MPKAEKESGWSGFAIAGFVLSFMWIFAFLGIIFSSIGLAKTGKGKKKGKGLAIAGLIISVLMFIAAIGVMNGSSTSNNPYTNSSITHNSNQNANIDPYASLIHNSDLVILDYNSSYGEFGNLEVSGTAQNIANAKLSYAEIDAKFYDKEGAVLSTSLANINNLAPNEKWKFKIMYLGLDTSNVDKYSLSIGTTW